MRARIIAAWASEVCWVLLSTGREQRQPRIDGASGFEFDVPDGDAAAVVAIDRAGALRSREIVIGPGSGTREFRLAPVRLRRLSVSGGAAIGGSATLLHHPRIGVSWLDSRCLVANPAGAVASMAIAPTEVPPTVHVMVPDSRRNVLVVQTEHGPWFRDGPRLPDGAAISIAVPELCTVLVTDAAKSPLPGAVVYVVAGADPAVELGTGGGLDVCIGHTDPGGRLAVRTEGLVGRAVVSVHRGHRAHAVVTESSVGSGIRIVHDLDGRAESTFGVGEGRTEGEPGSSWARTYPVGALPAQGVERWRSGFAARRGVWYASSGRSAEIGGSDGGVFASRPGTTLRSGFAGQGTAQDGTIGVDLRALGHWEESATMDLLEQPVGTAAVPSAIPVPEIRARSPSHPDMSRRFWDSRPRGPFQFPHVPSRPVALTAVDPSGSPVVGARVQVQFDAEFEARQLERYRSGEPCVSSPISAFTDERGRVTFRAPDAVTRLRIEVTCPGFAPHWTSVAAKDDVSIELDTEAWVRIEHCPAGTPVRWEFGEIGPEFERLLRSVAAMERDADDSIWFGPLPAMRLSLTVGSKSYDLDLRAGSTELVDVRRKE